MRVVRHLVTLISALAVLGVAAAPASGKIETGVSGNLLLIVGDDADDTVAVVCSPLGQVKINGKDPDDGATGCSKIVEVDAQTGLGNDVVDFSGVSDAFGEAAFPGFGTRTGAAASTGGGNDRYLPSPEAFNLFFGEEGEDQASGGPVRDLLDGGPGADLLRGGSGGDTVKGGGDADRLFGGPGVDTLSGGDGNDFLAGDEGADALGGDNGRDRLRGGPGRDRLLGGLGRDTLNGGPDKDREVQDPPKTAKPKKP